MTTMTAVRLADRFNSIKSPISFQTEGQIQHHVMISSIVFAFLGIFIMWMGHNQREHRFIIHDVDVSFEFTCPPPEPRYHMKDTLQALSLEEGSKPANLANND